MSKTEEKWIIASKKADFYGLAEKFQVDPVLIRVLRNRDVVGEDAIRRFLQGTRKDIPSPSLLKGMEEACLLLEEKIRRKARLRIIGDYDIDGICSTYILLTGLTALGLPCDYDIPDRVADGYGMNMRMTEDAVRDGIDTMITCDNGISAWEPIQAAKKAGLTVIVTDHHEIPKNEDGSDRLPPADCVIDGKRQDCPYPFKEICGAQTALKLIRELVRHLNAPESIWEELVEFAAFAAVGDVMPLKEENRILVKEGLKRLAHTKNTGMRALIRACGLEGRELSAYHLGFVLGPCLNASGRLESAKLSIELFCCDDAEKAGELAERLRQLNDKRKDMTELGIAAAEEKIAAEEIWKDDVFVIHLPDCHESLAGIIAGRIRERYNHPVIVLTGTGETVKGSGRSIPAYSMFDRLCEAKDLLLKFGGHPLAAGLSLKAENIPAFRHRLCEKSGLSEEDFTLRVMIDAAMPADYITERLVDQLKLVEPCGTGNERPLFAEAHFEILSARVVGRNRNVLQMNVRNEKNFCLKAVYYGDPEEVKAFLTEKFGEAECEKAFRGEKNRCDIALAYTPSVNEYNGIRSLEITVKHYCHIPR